MSICLTLPNNLWTSRYKMSVSNFNRPQCSYFWFFANMVLLKVVHPLRVYQNTDFMVLRWLVQVLQPHQKFERPPLWNGCSYDIKNYGVEVTFNGMTFLLHFLKIYQLVQKLILVRQTERIMSSLASFFSLGKVSRLKKLHNFYKRYFHCKTTEWRPANIFI
jgi:hypothetical protein